MDVMEDVQVLGWLKVLGLGSVLFASIAAQALPAPLVIKPGRPSVLSRSLMSALGGEAGPPISLISVRREPGAPGAERVVLTFGDREGKPLRQDPGFFHVTLDKDAKRVVIDLAQVTQTAVDPRQLARELKSSKIVAGSEMTMDPQDHSTNITLNLKSAVTLKVATASTNASQLIIEMASTGKPIK